MSYPPAPPVRRRRRWPWVLLVTVVVLAALVVVADRVALGLAEDKAASALQSSQHLENKPDVSVPGFPFLTQLAARDFDEIDVTATGVMVGPAKDLDLQRVAVALHNVTVSGDYSTFHADTATANATIAYSELTRVLGTPISDGGAGRLRARPTVHVLGRSLTATVSARVRTSGQAVAFTDPQVNVGGVAVPAAVLGAFTKIFSTTISLAGLPFHVRVTGVAVGSSGVVVSLAGSDLTYTRS